MSVKGWLFIFSRMSIKRIHSVSMCWVPRRVLSYESFGVISLGKLGRFLFIRRVFLNLNKDRWLLKFDIGILFSRLRLRVKWKIRCWDIDIIFGGSGSSFMSRRTVEKFYFFGRDKTILVHLVGAHHILTLLLALVVVLLNFVDKTFILLYFFVMLINRFNSIRGGADKLRFLSQFTHLYVE